MIDTYTHSTQIVSFCTKMANVQGLIVLIVNCKIGDGKLIRCQLNENMLSAFAENKKYCNMKEYKM